MQWSWVISVQWMSNSCDFRYLPSITANTSYKTALANGIPKRENNKQYSVWDWIVDNNNLTFSKCITNHTSSVDDDWPDSSKFEQYSWHISIGWQPNNSYISVPANWDIISKGWFYKSDSVYGYSLWVRKNTSFSMWANSTFWIAWHWNRLKDTMFYWADSVVIGVCWDYNVVDSNLLTTNQPNPSKSKIVLKWDFNVVKNNLLIWTTQIPELVDVWNTGNVKSDNFFITNQQ